MSLGQNEQVSRRDFLKLSASGVLGLALSRLGVDGALARESSYRLVHGVEVYGLDEKIDTLEKAKNLTFEFDLDFERKLPKDIKSKNRWEQREYAMPRDKRLVQFVVTESTYKEFLSKKAETGVSKSAGISLTTGIKFPFLAKALIFSSPSALAPAPSSERFLPAASSWTTNKSCK